MDVPTYRRLVPGLIVAILSLTMLTVALPPGVPFPLSLQAAPVSAQDQRGALSLAYQICLVSDADSGLTGPGTFADPPPTANCGVNEGSDGGVVTVTIAQTTAPDNGGTQTFQNAFAPFLVPAIPLAVGEYLLTITTDPQGSSPDFLAPFSSSTVVEIATDQMTRVTYSVVIDLEAEPTDPITEVPAPPVERTPVVPIDVPGASATPRPAPDVTPPMETGVADPAAPQTEPASEPPPSQQRDPGVGLTLPSTGTGVESERGRGTMLVAIVAVLSLLAASGAVAASSPRPRW